MLNSALLATLAVLSLAPVISHCYVEKPGPKYVPTVGHPWPLPKVWTKSDLTYSIDGHSFSFRVVDNTCDILEDAIVRYMAIVNQIKRHRPSRRRNLRKGRFENRYSINEVCIKADYRQSFHSSSDGRYQNKCWGSKKSRCTI